ncbi:MAG: hypothetical protein DHS20C16_19520 [Phycisphaerae bacterium]|nr:MAG: hypothetical protein DHS20C16_19520 [Phycisphaerae bacterium]
MAQKPIAVLTLRKFGDQNRTHSSFDFGGIDFEVSSHISKACEFLTPLYGEVEHV